MIDIDRRDASRFCALVRRCVAGRPRGLAPPVILHQCQDCLTLSAVLEETAIALTLPRSGRPEERLVVPFATLAALHGAGRGAATFEVAEGGAVRCHWPERGQTRSQDSGPIPTEQLAAELPPLGTLHAVQPALLHALHACGQTASRTSVGRYALTRVQLRGQAGTVIGSDGRQLLIWGGFDLPIVEDLLVPAVPVFGSTELAAETEVRVGRTASHVTVAVGPWVIWLAVDTTAHFPDVTAVLPKSARTAKLVFNEADAAALLQDVQQAGPAGDQAVPVVLAFDPRPAVRWPAGTPGRRGPLNLMRSTCTGPATSVALDATLLARALALGFREVRCASAQSPALFCDEHRRYLVVNCEPATATGSADLQTALPGPRAVCSTPHDGEQAMSPVHNEGPPADRPAAEDVLDPLTEAEALRVALMEVGRRVSRLIASLRQLQKQRRALQAAWSSLRHFGLGTKEES